MKNMANTVIPKKFAESGRSFVDKITQDKRKARFGTFAAFPKDVQFDGIDEAEEIVLMVRRDPASFLVQYLIILAFLFSPVFFFIVLGALGIKDGSLIALGLGGSLVFLLIAFTIALDTFLKWYYSVAIITDQRIVDVDFHNVLFHSYAEAQLEKIEDVTHEVAGFMGSVFDYGNVYVQTAGATNEFEFMYVPRPRDVQDVLLDLLEMKQKGEI